VGDGVDQPAERVAVVGDIGAGSSPAGRGPDGVVVWQPDELNRGQVVVGHVAAELPQPLVHPWVAGHLGYQAVGIMPSTLPDAASITSTSLSPELTAYSVVPLGERASESGLVPTGAPW
jgi:hypothetical protein